LRIERKFGALKPWLRILPYGFVVWLARRHCERHTDAFGMDAYNLFRGEMLSIERVRKP
jgi:hypothetical protein